MDEHTLLLRSLPELLDPALSATARRLTDELERAFALQGQPVHIERALAVLAARLARAPAGEEAPALTAMLRAAGGEGQAEAGEVEGLLEAMALARRLRLAGGEGQA